MKTLTAPRPRIPAKRADVTGILIHDFQGVNGWQFHTTDHCSLNTDHWSLSACAIAAGCREYLKRYQVCTDDPFQGYRTVRFHVTWADGTVHHGILDVDRAGALRGRVTLQERIRHFCLANAEHGDEIATHCRHLLNHCEL